METIGLLALALLLGGAQPKEENLNYVPSNSEAKQENYNASATRISDVTHTDLAVSFDWEKQYLHGTATIVAKPYFHPNNQLTLDAKGFDIHAVEMNREALTYDYSEQKLTIQLDRTYTRDENYTLIISYTAKPNELTEQGSAAITDAKGLYFINPLGEEDKPQQIWTQGETEASSCWFPTIDKPNERMTQNIAITVLDKFTTLSNGLLVKSEKNADGTRTDYWEQALPHVPYLAMMAIGEFNITSDQWREIKVDYYLEDDYHPYADQIFGRTPEMLEHFSEVLGVDYPWEKYAQVVVRDFVSGAMENTTAVIHYDQVQMTDREMLDKHEEDIIAHELFHHWFGDLVTCENWSNIPLNESFATYGEYLWREKGFGRMSADEHIDEDLNGYLRESQSKQVDMIRFNYGDKEEMFDNHSYAKGGRILHMLRHYLGDDAFFNGLETYLNDNAYATVEIHQLRIAMEKVCGEDLNWFFNQWFLSSGHPVLAISYEYDDSAKTQWVHIEQLQNLETTPLYRLPMAVDVYENGKVERHLIEVTDGAQSFSFKVASEPSNIIVDAEHILLAEIIDEKPSDWWLEQLKAPLYMDQKFVLENLDGAALLTAVQKNLQHDYWGVRSLATEAAERLEDQSALEAQILSVAQGDGKTIVRAAAINFLATLENKEAHEALFAKACDEQSYAVSGAGLNALAKTNEEQALAVASRLEKEAKKELRMAVMRTYALHGGVEQMNYFTANLETATNYDLYISLAFYVEYLKKQELSTTLSGIAALLKVADEATSWMVWVSKDRLKAVLKHLESQETEGKTLLTQLEEAKKEIKARL